MKGEGKKDRWMKGDEKIDGWRERDVNTDERRGEERRMMGEGKRNRRRERGKRGR
jgi:hypothetical protein